MLGAAAADWLVIGPEGTGSLDIRATFQTDDGAIVYGHYTGRLDASRGVTATDHHLRRTALSNERRAVRVA